MSENKGYWYKFSPRGIGIRLECNQLVVRCPETQVAQSRLKKVALQVIARQAGKGYHASRDETRRCTTREASFVDLFQEISNRTNWTDPSTWESNSSSNFLRGPLVRSHSIFDGFVDKCCAPLSDLGWYHREAAPNFPVTGWWQLRDPVRTGTQQFWKCEYLWSFSLHNHTGMS